MRDRSVHHPALSAHVILHQTDEQLHQCNWDKKSNEPGIANEVATGAAEFRSASHPEEDLLATPSCVW